MNYPFWSFMYIEYIFLQFYFKHSFRKFISLMKSFSLSYMISKIPMCIFSCENRFSCLLSLSDLRWYNVCSHLIFYEHWTYIIITLFRTLFTQIHLTFLKFQPKLTDIQNSHLYLLVQKPTFMLAFSIPFQLI